MSSANPTCIADVLVDNPNFPEAAVDALKDFARAKPWRGNRQEREEKFKSVIAALNQAVGMNVSCAFDSEIIDGPSVNSRIDFADPAAPTILFTGKLSVATLLYLYAGCMAPYDETMSSHWGRMRWAANVFKRFFPRSFAALDTSGAYLMPPRIGQEFPPSTEPTDE